MVWAACPGPDGLTELEAAQTPNMDRLVSEGLCGLSTPVRPGITPGSGPGHLGLFGYDPLAYDIGRGVLEALGIDFTLGPKDLAARGNFCTVDPATGNITDRRAGRIPSEVGAALVEKLRADQAARRRGLCRAGEGISVRARAARRRAGRRPDRDRSTADRRAAAARQGDSPRGRARANLLNQWLAEARKLLADEHPANSLNLRGLAKVPPIPQMPDIYKMKMGAIATYPMYRGIARLVGMDVLKTGDTMEDEVVTLRENWDQYDFFFFHVKKTDSNGEDGNFEGKKAVIEHTDAVDARHHGAEAGRRRSSPAITARRGRSRHTPGTSCPCCCGRTHCGPTAPELRRAAPAWPVAWATSCTRICCH